MNRTTQRNVGIELFRVCAMLAIVSRHVLSWNGAPSWAPRIFGWGVVSFAFISGYYGIRFKPSRLIGLWLLAMVASLVPWLMLPHVFGQEVGYRDILFSSWYLNAYSILVLFAPLINRALECGGERLSVIVVPLFVCMCWSWGQEFFGIKEWVPQVAGFGKYSFFALAYIYVAARCCRMREWFLHAPKSVHAIVGIATLLLFPVFCNTTSIVTLLFVMVAFRFFEQLAVPSVVGRVVLFVAPSLFSVYLLHTNALGSSVSHLILSHLAGPLILRYVIAGALIFIGCCLVDFVRRMALMLVHPALKGVSDAVDSWYDKVVKRMESFI